MSPAAARDLQLSLAGQVELIDRFGDIRLVAGIDIGFEQTGKLTRAAVAVLRLPDLAAVEQHVARQPTRFPYVPGLLSFREIPAAVAALAALRATPDLLLCDGHGFAHPRRFGLACHLGWLLDVPSIGVAKSRLLGTFDEPGPERGAAAPLHDRGEVIGAALRSRTGVGPVFVSSGHRASARAARSGWRWPAPAATGCPSRSAMPTAWHRRAEALRSRRPSRPAGAQ